MRQYLFYLFGVLLVLLLPSVYSRAEDPTLFEILKSPQVRHAKQKRAVFEGIPDSIDPNSDYASLFTDEEFRKDIWSWLDPQKKGLFKKPSMSMNAELLQAHAHYSGIFYISIYIPTPTYTSRAHFELIAPLRQAIPKKYDIQREETVKVGRFSARLMELKDGNTCKALIDLPKSSVVIIHHPKCRSIDLLVEGLKDLYIEGLASRLEEDSLEAGAVIEPQQEMPTMMPGANLPAETVTPNTIEKDRVPE